MIFDKGIVSSVSSILNMLSSEIADETKVHKLFKEYTRTHKFHDVKALLIDTDIMGYDCMMS